MPHDVTMSFESMPARVCNSEGGPGPGARSSPSSAAGAASRTPPSICAPQTYSHCLMYGAPPSANLSLSFSFFSCPLFLFLQSNLATINGCSSLLRPLASHVDSPSFITPVCSLPHFLVMSAASFSIRSPCTYVSRQGLRFADVVRDCLRQAQGQGQGQKERQREEGLATAPVIFHRLPQLRIFH